MVNNHPTQRPGLQTRRNETPHPSIGCGEPYSPDIRDLVMRIHDLGDPGEVIKDLIDTLQTARVYPSNSTISRLVSLRNNLGHYRACRRTGNRFAERLRGSDLIFLSLFRVVYPKASAAEVNAFLYRVNFGNATFQFYSHSQITRSEQMIGLSKKCGSTTAYQAYLPVNIQKRWNYWNLPFPLGIADVSRSNMIDLDECGLFVETANRKRGKSYVGFRVREPGPYSKSENGICYKQSVEKKVNQEHRREDGQTFG